MDLIGDTGTLTDAEQVTLGQLPYTSGSVLKVFKTARSGATVLILDVVDSNPLRNKPHVVKLQDSDQGSRESDNHDAALEIVDPVFVPALVAHIVDADTGLSATVYEIAGSSVFRILPLSFYLHQQIAAAEAIIKDTAQFIENLIDIKAHLTGRRTLTAFDLCAGTVNRDKNRLDGPSGLGTRLEALLPGISSRHSLVFDGLTESLPNPVAFIYRRDLWQDCKVITPIAPTHGDLHSDNVLWQEAARRLSVIDWATFSMESVAFADMALLEIDIVHRSLDCYDEQGWREWNYISAFLAQDLTSLDHVPNGARAVQLWNLIKPLRDAIKSELLGVEQSLQEVFEAVYFLTLYSTTLTLLRNQYISQDRKIGLLLLAARYLGRSLLTLGVEWTPKQPLAIPAPHEFVARLSSEQPGRALELEYLDRLLERWSDSFALYTKLRGEATGPLMGQCARAGASMDLFYDLLDKRRDGLFPGASASAYEITDVLQEVLTRRRVALLGEPGAGKSFTLRQLAHTLAQEARRDPDAPIPVLIPLGGYGGEIPLANYLAQDASGQLGELRTHLDALGGAARLAFLLDGVNEMSTSGQSGEGQREIAVLANAFPDAIFVITCRYSEQLPTIALSRITIRPMDPLRVKEFLLNYLGADAGDKLFWLLVDRDCQGRDQYWPRYLAAGGTEETFWLSRTQPEGLNGPWASWDWDFWLKIRDNPRSYLSLARTPYMLAMIVGSYAERGILPKNRGQLFKLFVDSLMAREQKMCEPGTWIPEQQQYAALSHLAYSMQSDQLGTSVERAYAVEKLQAKGMLDLAQGECILHRIAGRVAFTHQLLQEFFAAYALDKRRLERQLPATAIWPKTEWWKPVGFEETSVILSGIYHESPYSVLDWLRDANPELAARCVVDGGIIISPEFRQLLISAWLPRLANITEPVLARAAIGRALGLINGDTRPGVTFIDDKTGLPRFEWVPLEHAAMTSGPGSSYDGKPLWVSKYLITNAQYASFVRDGGYTSAWRNCWTDEGWDRKGNSLGPTDYSETLVLPNHPRIGLNWYEAVAYSRWLDQRFRERDQSELQIRLPTEREWIWLAGGRDNRRFPWGNEFDPELCNVIGIEGTTAVGIFPNGAAECGVLDVIGNAWKWCLTCWNPDPEAPEDNRINGVHPRCYRGGSWGSNLWRTTPWSASELECHRRHWIVPEDDRPDAIGMFLVRGSRLY